MVARSDSTFAFRARTASGEQVSGSIVARNREDVADHLRDEGLFITSINSNPIGSLTSEDIEQIRTNQRTRRISREDVVSFAQQLSVMIETGVPLPEGLEAIARQTRRKEFREVIESVHDEVCGGAALSEALARWPRIFPGVMVSLLRAAELSGTTALMLSRVSDYLGRELRTRRQVRGALLYPGFMLGAGLLVVVFLVTFILPRFAKIYEMRSASLPTPTRILLSIGEFVSTGYLIYGPVLVGVLIGMLLFRRSGTGRRFLDWMKLRLPVLRSIHVNLYVTRSTRTMSTLLSAGVNLMDVIQSCRTITRNIVFDKVWDDMEEHVRDGRRLSVAFEESNCVPANIASMIAAGERSGRLPEVMERVAEYSEEELDLAIKKSTSLIEPLMIIFMGLLVGAVAIALLLPIFRMSSIVAG
jgi:type IV pilus assembly protein PilC